MVKMLGGERAKMRGIDFGPVWAASGALAFFGEGWPYHQELKRRFPRGFDLSGLTFVAKTVTLNPLKGNMPSDDYDRPLERRPRCIAVTPLSFLRGAAVNAVGLTNRGAKAYFDDGRWQQRRDPFFISFAPQGEGIGEKCAQMERFVQMLRTYCETRPYKQDLGLQLNLSCPNTGEESGSAEKFVAEARALVEACYALPSEIALVIKINILMSPRDARSIADHPRVDGLCVSNTIPWDALPSLGISRRLLFGSNTSPLIKRGFKLPGGVSGDPCRPLTREWIRCARAIGITKHINACGGILAPEHVWQFAEAGASSISFGSVIMLRPWRVHDIIEEAYGLCLN